MYIEVIAQGSNPLAKAAARRRAVLFDTVNRLDDPNFMLWLDDLVRVPILRRQPGFVLTCAGG